MGVVAGSETTQWFLEGKAKKIKWYSEFEKIIGRVKTNQLQPNQLNQKFKSLSPQDFRTFRSLKSHQHKQRDITHKRIKSQDFTIIGGLKKESASIWLMKYNA